MDFNYRISGEGPDLVLVHGLGGSLESWSVIATILEKRFRVHRYDLRGHGKAGNPDGPWQLGDFVSDLEHYIHEHNLEKPGIAGFSLGGLIAQGYTLANVDSVDITVHGLGGHAGHRGNDRARGPLRYVRAGSLERRPGFVRPRLH